MDQYYVLGNPVAHSHSPRIHTRFAQLTGHQLHYDRLLVPLGDFARTLAHLLRQGTRGCNVTVPFKAEAFAAAHSHTDRAQLAEAANTLMFTGSAVHADNTDGAGLVHDIQNNAGVNLAGREVLLIGAGGAAAGALAPLLATAPRRLVLVNRRLDRAQALAARHRSHPSLQQVLQKTELLVQDIQGLQAAFDVVINASASSLAGADVPVPAAVLKPGALAYDMMYGSAAQGFMDWARAHGAVPREGLGMLVEQAAESFALWRQVRPPAAQVLQEIRAALDKADTSISAPAPAAGQPV